jgi:DNA-binding MarR family transcriptional regulator
LFPRPEIFPPRASPAPRNQPNSAGAIFDQEAPVFAASAPGCSIIRKPNDLEGEEMGPTSDTVADELLNTIPRIMQALRAEMRRHRSGDLTVVQFRALSFLHRRPGSSLAELAEHIGLTPPTTSALVDGLVSKGLLRRVEAQGDRRRVDLSLSAAGCVVWEAARHGARENLVTRLDGMRAVEREQIAAALQVLDRLYPEDIAPGKSK